MIGQKYITITCYRLDSLLDNLHDISSARVIMDISFYCIADLFRMSLVKQSRRTRRLVCIKKRSTNDKLANCKVQWCVFRYILMTNCNILSNVTCAFISIIVH